MTLQQVKVRNGQSVELSRISLWEEKEFRTHILEECRSGARLVNLFAMPEENGSIRLFCLLGYDSSSNLSLFSMKIFRERPVFQSLTPELPQAHWFERELAEQYAIIPDGHPWLKPVRYHKNYRGVADLWPQIAEKPIPGHYPFFQVKGEEVHEVAVGPVHAGIIEPGHFRFQCHGEEILHLEIQLGYQHRGIEKMLGEVTLERSVLLTESIAGDSVIGHVLAFCMAIESLTDCDISPRAESLRAIALELERLSNHVGDLGTLGTDIGFLPTAAYFGKLRGEFLNLLMELTGNRYGRSFCRPGGVLFDMDDHMVEDFRRRFLKTKKDLKDISELFFQKPSVLSRLEGVGIVSKEAAHQLGLVGPPVRACGLSRDVRADYPFGMYRFHHIPISLANNGDIYARALIRWLESQRSIEFLLELLTQIPKGELFVTPGPLKPNNLAVAMVESWRGEAMHVIVTDSVGKIVRYKIKDPSFHNWMGLAMAVRGTQISDFPICNKSFNLSCAGHDL